MRLSVAVFRIVVAAVVAFLALGQSGAQQPKPEQAEAQEPNPRIIPVVMLKPGEQKELLLSTWCRLGPTRGGGLTVGLMQDGTFRPQKDGDGKRGKVWKGDGLTLEVPDFGEAEKVAGQPVYEPLKKRGLNAFVVKVAAAKDAKPGLFDVHVADTTCSGSCATDFRVLIVAP